MNRPLAEIVKSYKTDKADHDYIQYYAARFETMRDLPIRLLEIGIMGGESLRMWREYFPAGWIYGIDCDPPTIFQEERITTFLGGQQDETFLKSVLEKTGPLDIVIDDGSHCGVHHVASFQHLWPHVKPGGWYAIEDCQSLFNTCWTQSTDRTILHLLWDELPRILTQKTDIAEAVVVGSMNPLVVGRNDGMIFFRKANPPC